MGSAKQGRLSIRLHNEESFEHVLLKKVFYDLKPVISPTNQYPVLKINHCDIVFISQVQNLATCINVRDCIFGYATHTLAEF